MAKKIEEFMLDDELRRKINKTSANSKIDYDDLSPDIVNKLRSLGSASNGMLAYDDQELRSRLITLENNAATRAEFFNKVSDKLTKEQLNQELKDLVDEMQDFSDILKTRYSKTESDQKYRFKEDKLTVEDLSSDLANNLKNMRDNLNAIKTELATLSFSKNELNNLKSIVANMPSERLSKSAADQLYRSKKDQIRLQDVENSLADPLRVLQENSDKLQNAVSLRDLRNYRLSSTNISFEDLDQSLKAKIRLVDNLNTNIEKTITNLINNRPNSGTSNSNNNIGNYQILENESFQTFIDQVFGENLISSSNPGQPSITEAIYALYLSNQDKNRKITSLENTLRSLQSSIQLLVVHSGLLERLKNADVIQHINQLYQLTGLKKVDIDSLADATVTNPGLHIVEIEDSGTVIKNNKLDETFAESTALFKETATSIQSGAINNCPELMYLDIPSIKALPIGAIVSCPKLTVLRLPSITRIEDKAIFNCNNLSKIILPYDYQITGKERFPAGTIIERCSREKVSPETNSPKYFNSFAEGNIANLIERPPEEANSSPSSGVTPSAGNAASASSSTGSASTTSTGTSNSALPGV